MSSEGAAAGQRATDRDRADRPDLALFGEFDPTGGIGRAIGKLARYAAEQGLRVDVLTYAKGKPLFAANDRPGRVTHRHLTDSRHKAVIVARLGLYLRRQKPRALLSTTDRANRIVIGSRRVPGANHTRRHLSLWNHISAVPRREAVRRRKYRQLRRLYPQAEAIIACAQSLTDDLVQNIGLPADKVVTNYGPMIDPALHEQAQQGVEHPWFQPDQPPVVLGVGRLMPQKDFPTLLRAFAELRQRLDARLVILGEGHDRPELEALAKELGIGDAVDLPGFAHNPYAYMARASLFTLSSAWEGLPLVLIEAMALGTPVVATDCPSGPGEVLTGKLADRLVAVGDVSGLAAAMQRALTTGRADPDAFEQAVRPFTVDVACQRYLETLGLGEA